MGGRAVGARDTTRLTLWPRVALTALLWLAWVRPPEPAANAELDPGWGAVQAFILRGGAQAGTETVFTFGPLGWFNNPVFVSELYATHLAWEIVFKLAAAVLVVAVLARLPRKLDFALAYVAALCAGAGPDGCAFVVLFANAMWVGARRERPLWISIAALAPSIALGLVKFPYFVAAVAAVLALVILFARDCGRRAAGFGAGVVVLFTAAWSATGQSPLNVPAWIATSWAMASGYGAALGIDTPRFLFALALIVLAAEAFALRAALRVDHTPGRVVFVALFAFTAWLAFKNGFVRAQDKPLAVFDFAAVALFLLPVEGLDTSRAARAVRRGAALAALAGHALVLGPGWSAPRAFGAELVERIGANAAFLARPGAVRADFEADRAAKRIEYGLPRVRERAGRDAVDVLGAAQGVAFLNDLAYTPRPVFQSYAAYTPELQELNRRFFTSARAPRWVLFGSSAIDDHLPAIEDAAAFAVISRDFRVELEERGWLLLAKREPPPPVTDVGSFVVSRTARFGERLDFASLLPASATPPRVLTLRLLVEPSLAGRASTALVKSPTLALEVEDARGRRRTWRIAAGYVANDFVISPLLDTPERYRAWFHGDMELATRSVRVLAADEDRWAFDETYRFELRRADGMAPPVEPDYRARRLAAIVKPAPDAIEAAAEPEMVALRAELETLVVGTPASLRFDLQAGRHRLSAFHGLHPRLADATRPAGANFVVVLRASDGTERELARRAVQPGERPVAARFTLDFDAAAGSTLFLRSEPAQAGAPAAVNAFWALVSVDRVP